MNRVRIGSGLVGATSVAALNYLAARFLPSAPRLDVLGLQLTTAAFKKLGIQPPSGLPAKALALLGSLASNSMFYGLVGSEDSLASWRGARLGHGTWRPNIATRLRGRQTRDRSDSDDKSGDPHL